jgi:hypothetical protein
MIMYNFPINIISVSSFVFNDVTSSLIISNPSQIFAYLPWYCFISVVLILIIELLP